jgi:CDP-diacylglycerol--glycerol-3-phosphate 3-phosphatidyltransferase
MNLPNKLTCSRFVFAAVLMLVLHFDFPFAKTLALVLFALASITDALDGHLARTKYGVTSFGKLMDPLADKVLVTVALVGFVGMTTQYYLPGRPLVPAYLVVIILVREFMVTGLRLLAVEQGQVIAAGKLGKWKTVLQITAIVITLLCLVVMRDFMRHSDETTVKHVEFTARWLIWFFMTAAAFLTVLSGWEYFMENKKLLDGNNS